MPTHGSHGTLSSVHRNNSSDDHPSPRPSSLHQLHSTSSYELGLHPADPHSTLLPTSPTVPSFSTSHHSNFAPGPNGHGAIHGSVEGNGSWDEHRFGPDICTERVPGQELWVYGGHGGFVHLTLPTNLTQRLLFFSLKHVHILALPY